MVCYSTCVDYVDVCTGFWKDCGAFDRRIAANYVLSCRGNDLGLISECLTETSTIFTDNAHLFGKVYFPRMITPLAIVVSNLIRFAVQFGMFIVSMGYYWWQGVKAS